MRAAWWREVRELLLPALGFWFVLGLVGSELPTRGLTRDWISGLALLGWTIGLFQGLLDRRRRDDGFLLHRPMGALSIHGSRMVAGLTIVIGGAVVAAVAGIVDVTLYERRAERMRQILGRAFSEQPHDWGVSRGGNTIPIDAWGALLGVSLLLGGWALMRFAVSRRRIPTAIFALGALAVVGWSLVARCTTVSGAALSTMAIGAVCSALSLVDLAGDRR